MMVRAWLNLAESQPLLYSHPVMFFKRDPYLKDKVLKGLVSMQSCRGMNPKLEKWRVGTLKAPCTLPNIGSIINNNYR